MLFFEDWVDRVVNAEGQVIKDLRQLSFDYSYLYSHVFKSALEQMHRSRPVVVTVNVVGPRWIKTPDCQAVDRVTSNFLLTNQAQAAAIYTGREVRQNLEENDYAVWVPMGLSTLRYFRKFEYNFDRRLSGYALSQYDIYPNVPYDFLLPFECLGGYEVTNAKRDPSEFVVSVSDDNPRKITVVYHPNDGSTEPLTAMSSPLADREPKSAFDALNEGIATQYTPSFTDQPTLVLNGTSKYPFFNSDQWSNDSELIELLMRSRFLRLLAHSKANFVVSEVEFNPNNDQLLTRANDIEERTETMLTKNNLWWEF